MAGLQMLKHTVGKAGVLECSGVALGNERRLLRDLEDHAVPRHERGNHGVHGRKIRIVPRCKHQDDAQRLPADEAAKAFLRLGNDVRQRVSGDADHVAGALLETAADLRRALRERATHLPGQLRGELVGAGDHRFHRALA